MWSLPKAFFTSPKILWGTIFLLFILSLLTLAILWFIPFQPKEILEFSWNKKELKIVPVLTPIGQENLNKFLRSINFSSFPPKGLTFQWDQLTASQMKTGDLKLNLKLESNGLIFSSQKDFWQRFDTSSNEAEKSAFVWQMARLFPQNSRLYLFLPKKTLENNLPEFWPPQLKDWTEKLINTHSGDFLSLGVVDQNQRPEWLIIMPRKNQGLVLAQPEDLKDLKENLEKSGFFQKVTKTGYEEPALSLSEEISDGVKIVSLSLPEPAMTFSIAQSSDYFIISGNPNLTRQILSLIKDQGPALDKTENFQKLTENTASLGSFALFLSLENLNQPSQYLLQLYPYVSFNLDKKGQQTISNTIKNLSGFALSKNNDDLTGFIKLKK